MIEETVGDDQLFLDDPDSEPRHIPSRTCDVKHLDDEMTGVVRY